MAVSTAADIIRGALQAIGKVAAGETVSGADSDISLELMNGLLDQWAAESLAIYETARTTWTITQAASFTVGAGGTINIPRPVFPAHVSYFDPALTNPVEIPLTPLTDDAYAAWPLKTLTNTYPSAWWFNPTYASGLASLSLLPIPTTSLTGVMYAPKQIARYAATTTTFALPPGYERFIRTNLALELCGPFRTEPSQLLVLAARESKATVKRANTRLMDMSVDAGALGRGGGSWSILTGP